MARNQTVYSGNNDEKIVVNVKNDGASSSVKHNDTRVKATALKH